MRVIPIAKTAPAGGLSYFARKAPAPGTILSAPLRGKTVPALVEDVEPVAAAKTAIRASPFALRKISPAGFPNPFLPEFLRAARAASLFFAASEGATLHALLPSVLLEALAGGKRRARAARESPATSPERLAFQAERDERTAAYRSLIREEFARGRSVFIAVPAIVDAEAMHGELARGIESRAFLFHGSLGKRELALRARAARAARRPILVVATPPFLALPRPDLGTIVLEEEGGRGWRSVGRPYLDFRVFAELLARELSARLILAGFPLRAETVFRYRERELDEFAPLRARAAAGGSSLLVDMREEKPPRAGEPAVIGETLREALADTLARGGRAVLFAARRGLAPVTVCGDCGTPASCGRCGMPVALFKAESGNVFLCSSCGGASAPSDRCATCGGWRLAPLGIGVQRAEAAVRGLFPDFPVIPFDRERIATHAAGLARIRDFYASPGTVLVGTELVLPYLRAPVALAAVVSADSLLALPEWSAAERLFGILLKLRAAASERFIVQTREPGRPLLRQALEGSLADFYREELAAREAYGYPPFATLVTLRLSGGRARLADGLARAARALGVEKLETYAPLAAGRSFSQSALLKVPRGGWPDKRLSAALASLPVSVEVRVNPDGLFG